MRAGMAVSRPADKAGMDRLKAWAPVLCCASLAKAAGCEAMQALSHTCRVLRAQIASRAPPGLWQARSMKEPLRLCVPHCLQTHLKQAQLRLCPSVCHRWTRLRHAHLQAALQRSVHRDFRLPEGTVPSYAPVTQLSLAQAAVRRSLAPQQMAICALAQMGAPPAVVPLQPDFRHWALLHPCHGSTGLHLVEIRPLCPPRQRMVRCVCSVAANQPLWHCHQVLIAAVVQLPPAGTAATLLAEPRLAATGAACAPSGKWLLTADPASRRRFQLHALPNGQYALPCCWSGPAAAHQPLLH